MRAYIPSALIPFVALLFFAACELEPEPVDQEVQVTGFGDVEVVEERVESEDAEFQVVRLVEGLENPWGMTWLPDGNMLITERPGRLNIVQDGELTEVDGLPEIAAQNQGGLLDVELHPDFDDNGWVYFTYSTPSEGEEEGTTGTALARAQLNGNQLTNVEELYVQEPGHSPGRHYGSRIVFQDDGTLLMTIGDRGQRDPAQDTQDASGSTLRLNDDGSTPDDNPFVDDDAYLDEIYTYGHRNAQGMAIHPATNTVWQHEHGPRGGDELNIIEEGCNYGWPDVTVGTEYSDDSPIGEDEWEEEMCEPVTYWEPVSIAPSGLAIYTGDDFPEWDGNLFVGALRQQHVRRVVLDGEEVEHQEELLSETLGRIRDIKQGPDGMLYILTDHEDGGLYRIQEVDEDMAADDAEMEGAEETAEENGEAAEENDVNENDENAQ